MMREASLVVTSQMKSRETDVNSVERVGSAAIGLRILTVVSRLGRRRRGKEFTACSSVDPKHNTHNLDCTHIAAKSLNYDCE